MKARIKACKLFARLLLSCLHFRESQTSIREDFAHPSLTIYFVFPSSSEIERTDTVRIMKLEAELLLSKEQVLYIFEGHIYI